MLFNPITWDLFQPKTDIFSARSLFWVHFKTVHYFSKPIFSWFSYKKNARQKLVIELCSAPFPPQKYCKVIYQIYAHFCCYWNIDFLQKYKKTILLLKRALSIPYVNRIVFYLFLCILKTFRKKIGFCIWIKLQWLQSSKDNAYVYIHKNKNKVLNVFTYENPDTFQKARQFPLRFNTKTHTLDVTGFSCNFWSWHLYTKAWHFALRDVFIYKN